MKNSRRDRVVKRGGYHHQKGKDTLPPPIRLDADLWDFRRVRPYEVGLCARYEYARESARFHSVLTDWLDSQIGWKGITIRDVLRKRGFENEVIRQHLRTSAPKAVILFGGDWIWFATDFPTPFLKCRDVFPRAVAERSKLGSDTESQLGFRVDFDMFHSLFKNSERAEPDSDLPKAVKLVMESESEPQDNRQMFAENQKTSAKHSLIHTSVTINFRAGQTEIVKQFENWLEKNWPPDLQRYPARKRPESPWTRLRRLAAWRLVEKQGFLPKNAFTNRRAVTAHGDRVKVDTSPEAGDVLPAYSTPDAWRNACAAAKQFIEELYPAT